MVVQYYKHVNEDIISKSILSLKFRVNIVVNTVSGIKERLQNLKTANS